MATRKALAADADLLEPGERVAIEGALSALDAAIRGDRPGLIQARTDALDEATRAWAGRRMDRAVAKAIAGKQVEDVEAKVAAARGVDAHLAEHRGDDASRAPTETGGPSAASTGIEARRS
jgi:molecular chaperone HscA